MNKFSKMGITLAMTAVVLVVTVLAACSPGAPLTICHATGDPAIPYEAITVTSIELNDHRDHINDIYPVPVGGCPTKLVEIIDGKITICHVTSSNTNPYNQITVSVNGLNGHGKHVGDIVPAPVGGCPDSLLLEDKITICHATGSETNPYNEITVSVNGLNGHDGHEGDIIPAPGDGCPTTRQ